MGKIRTNSGITQTELKKNLLYDPITGVFTWKINKGRNAKVNTVAGSLHPKGYIRIRISGIDYAAHRLSYLYMTGLWPVDLLDHINGVRYDNRWCNLQDIDNPGNVLKGKLRCDNTTGHKGISVRPNGSFQVNITRLGKRIYTKVFKTLKEAITAKEGVLLAQH